MSSDAVGVRELKARLSEFLWRVEAGQRLTVTDRGRPVALLTPVQPSARPDWAQTMVADGRARWDGGRPLGLARRIRSRGKLASQMVLDDRR
jgi:prevent-host-death family protein